MNFYEPLFFDKASTLLVNSLWNCIQCNASNVITGPVINSCRVAKNVPRRRRLITFYVGRRRRLHLTTTQSKLTMLYKILNKFLGSKLSVNPPSSCIHS